MHGKKRSGHHEPMPSKNFGKLRDGGMSGTPKNHGNLFTSGRKVQDKGSFGSHRVARRPSSMIGCYITSACVEARGLPDDCFELNVLRDFRDSYVARLPEGPSVLDDYEAKAKQIVSRIEELGHEKARAVYEYLYERGVLRSIHLIRSDLPDEAYDVYRSMCKELEELFWLEDAAESSGCSLTTACVEAKGLSRDCYEVRIMKLFREEYLLSLPEGPEIIADYEEKASRLNHAIDALGEQEALLVYEEIYAEHLAPMVLHYASGNKEQAYVAYARMCGELEERFFGQEGTDRG